MWTDALFARWADSACVIAVSANAWTLPFSVINILLTLLSNFSSFSTFWEHALHTLLEGRHSPLLLCCMHLTLKARWLEHPPMVKYEDADNCAKGRVKYRVKAAYVIINFIMNSLGPTCARTLDSDSWPAPCHTLCALRPSMPRALSGTKPRRLQLRKRVAIAQVIPSNKELQPIWLQCTVSELSKMTPDSHTKVKQWQVLEAGACYLY